MSNFSLVIYGCIFCEAISDYSFLFSFAVLILCQNYVFSCSLSGRCMQSLLSTSSDYGLFLEIYFFVKFNFFDRLDVLLDHFKMALDCFFAVWFVVGNVWIFGGHTSAAEAPNLYR